MKKMLAGLALAMGLLVLPNPAQAQVPDHIRHLWHGIDEVRQCHSILDSDAGTSWGGLRAQAEQQLDGALNELSAAVEYYRVNVRHVRHPWPPPQFNASEPGGGHHDHMWRVREGIRHLENARRTLDGEAGTDYGGHRETAETDINNALNLLHQAEGYWHNHH